MLAVELDGLSSTGEGVLVDLVLYLIGGVGHVDGGVLVAGAHLGVMAKQGGDELGVDQGWLRELEPGGNVPGDAEVGILVNGSRDQAGNVLLATKDVREGTREGGGGLDRREGYLANVVAAKKQKKQKIVRLAEETLRKERKEGDRQTCQQSQRQRGPDWW